MALHYMPVSMELLSAPEQRLAVDPPYIDYADSVYSKYKDRYEAIATKGQRLVHVVSQVFTIFTICRRHNKTINPTLLIKFYVCSCCTVGIYCLPCPPFVTVATNCSFLWRLLEVCVSQLAAKKGDAA